MKTFAYVLVALIAACNRRGDAPDVPPRVTDESADPREAKELRAALVAKLAVEVHDGRVLDAMRRVPRHRFVPGVSLARAYENVPLPIGYEQTISQPAIVAVMSEALELRGSERVLEIGTGSGYQAAVLSLLAKEVYSIELIPELGDMARKRLAELGYSNVRVLVGDGYRGWPEHAPFDRVIITAAPPDVPAALLRQLGDDGILVSPVGESASTQRLLRYRKSKGEMNVEDLGGVRFVPMVPAL